MTLPADPDGSAFHHLARLTAAALADLGESAEDFEELHIWLGPEAISPGHLSSWC